MEDGTERMAYVGYHVGPANVGKRWYSAEPELIRKVSGETYRMLMYLIERARRHFR